VSCNARSPGVTRLRCIRALHLTPPPTPQAEATTPPTASPSMESTQSQERAADSPGHAAAASQASNQPRRLRWTAAPEPPETKAGDRVVYYVDKEVREGIQRPLRVCWEGWGADEVHVMWW
jgi:hypothetical protein